jgi:hypothetical protein
LGSGVAILAPTAAMTMSGASDSTIRGNLLVGSFNYSGAASGECSRSNPNNDRSSGAPDGGLSLFGPGPVKLA